MSDRQMQLYTPVSELVRSTKQADITRLATSIMKFAPGGDKLTATEAAQMAIYSLLVDANPLAGEVFITEIGPQLGIPLYRRKAKEYNRIVGGNEDWDYSVDYRQAEPGEADFEPGKGDVAWVCILTDSKAKKEWEDTYMRFYNAFTDNGAPWDKADERARSYAGKLPTWEAVGVVGGNERFSQAEVERWEKQPGGKSKPIYKRGANGELIYKQEMFDRNERAKKRAEKLALKKRYPDLLIPEYGEIASEPEIQVLIQTTEGDLVKADDYAREKAKNLDEKQALLELGFEPDPSPADEPEPPPNFVDAEYEDVADPLWTEPDGDDPNSIYWDVTDSKGVPYRDKALSDLRWSFNGLNKAIKKYDKHPLGEDDIKKLDELKLKREAVHYWIGIKEEQERG